MTAFSVADRKAGVFMLVGSLTAAIIGGSSTIGLAGLGYEMGLVGAWWLLVSVPGLVALALVFSNRIRETDAYMLPEIMRRQYGGRHVSLAASLLIVTAWLGVIAAQMIAAGKILSVLWPESFDLLTVYTAGVVVPVIFGFYSRRLALHADGATAAIVGGGLVGGCAKCRGETISSLPRFFSAALLFGVSYGRRYLSFRKEK